MSFDLVSLGLCITAGWFHWVCVWNWRIVLRTVHGSLPHLRANHRVEVVHPLVAPLLIGALAMTAVSAARSHWSIVASVTAVLWCYAFVVQVLSPAKPCPRCKTGFWARIGNVLLLREHRTTSDV